MSNQPAPNRRDRAQAGRPPTRGEARGASGQLSVEALQALIDQTVSINAFVTSDRTQSGCAINARGNSGEIVGVRCRGQLNRFDIELELPSESGVKAASTLGERVGSVDLRWMVIPHSYAARSDREPPLTRLDTRYSQRIAMQEMTFSFGDGRDGFYSFGAGRTFPFASGSRPGAVVVSAIGNVTEGFGKFQGHVGNYTLCGELTPGGGFAGHIIARIVDERGDLRTRESLPSAGAGGERPDPQFTYLMWLAQKGKSAAQANRPSMTPDGQLRGMNIPMELKRGHFTFTAAGRDGFRSSPVRVGEVIGLEEGFGRGPQTAERQDGTALSPSLFEGVARYSFDDRGGRRLGAFTTNVLEGRRFDYRYASAPDEVSWRFGFFGPILYGSGCFRGVEGMFYGASNSFFKPPPGDHVITHCYFARLYDPEGKFRSASGGRRQ
ncbi:MAG TPA: hypothetical protein VEZ40_00135 [Pyrinomonadaceae bacterium]|nr:hypothetical protein [Pyrinomonadaceae bacterium]